MVDAYWLDFPHLRRGSDGLGRARISWRMIAARRVARLDVHVEAAARIPLPCRRECHRRGEGCDVRNGRGGLESALGPAHPPRAVLFLLLQSILVLAKLPHRPRSARSSVAGRTPCRVGPLQCDRRPGDRPGRRGPSRRRPIRRQWRRRRRHGWGGRRHRACPAIAALTTPGLARSRPASRGGALVLAGADDNPHDDNDRGRLPQPTRQRNRPVFASISMLPQDPDPPPPDCCV